MDELKSAIPKTALNFYVKLYCKKRKMSNAKVLKGHSVLMEATKSWLSLNKSEKEIFMSKYNIARAEYNKKIGEYLKNAEPYLKKRNLEQSKNLQANQINIAHQNRQEQLPEISYNMNEVGNIIEEASPILDFPNSINDMSEVLHTDTHADLETNEKYVKSTFIQDHLPEPAPPKVKSARELYEMLANNTENYVPWESLGPIPKRRYQSAVLSIKRTYINSYRAFLESLRSEELFNYYLNNKDSKT